MAFSGPLVADFHPQGTKPFTSRFAKQVGTLPPATGPVRCSMLLLPSVIAPESVGAFDQECGPFVFERPRQ
jgi:hypothetical protein